MRILWHHTKRATKHVSKKTGHFLFPYLWHYYTDTYKGRFHHLIVDSVLSMMILTLLAANVAIGGWLYVFFIPPEVEVELSVPAVVISGSNLTLDIAYNNLSKGVANVQFEVLTPTGFIATDDQLFQTIEELAAGEQGVLKAKGYFIGNVDEAYRFIAIYSYDYYGQHYEQVRAVTFTPVTSSFEVVTNVPDKILRTEDVSWTVEYVNNSTVPRTDACIALVIPESFTVIESSNEISDQNIVYLGEVESRAAGIITITGHFNNAIGEGKQVLGVSALDDCAAEQYVQTEMSDPIRVLTPRMSLGTSGAETVNVGTSARYTNSYTNTGDAPLRNVTLVATLNDFENRVSAISGNGGLVSGNTVTWTDSEILPGETHSQSFTINTNPNYREKNAEMSYSVRATAEIDDLGILTYTPSIAKSIKYNSTLNFAVQYRNGERVGEQFGYGPYPMEADNITAVRVFWEVQDFTNDLSNVTIQTTLPSQVEWTGMASVTEGSGVTYDPATRKVTWHTGSIPSFAHPQGASFEVRVRPNSQQIGKNINVTNETYFSARDSFTGVVLSRSSSALRTDDPIQPFSD